MTAPTPLTTDLSSDQQHLIEALYRFVTMDDDSHGEITTWPTWDHLTYLLEQENVDPARAGKAATDFPALERAFAPYTLIWRTQAGASRIPQPREQVGLTIAGLNRVDPATADRLAQMVARLAFREANLPPNPTGVREAKEPINELLTEFLKGPRRAGRVDMNVRTAAELLMHEYVPIANETGRQFIYEATLGGGKLAPFRGVETAGQYLDRVTALTPQPLRSWMPVTSTVEELPSAAETRSRTAEYVPMNNSRDAKHVPETSGFWARPAASVGVRQWVRRAPGPIRYQVFFSSTYKDLVAEREAVTQAVLRMGKCIPAGMELFSASNQPPWDVIRSALDGTDYLVLIIGNRSGALVPGEDISYTEKEYRYAVDNDIPVLAFLSSDSHPMLRGEIEPAKSQKALAAFRARVQSAALTEEWTTKDDLTNKVPNALWKAFEATPRPGWTRGPTVHSQTESQADVIRALLARTPALNDSDAIQDFLKLGEGHDRSD